MAKPVAGPYRGSTKPSKVFQPSLPPGSLPPRSKYTQSIADKNPVLGVGGGTPKAGAPKIGSPISIQPIGAPKPIGPVAGPYTGSPRPPKKGAAPKLTGKANAITRGRGKKLGLKKQMQAADRAATTRVVKAAAPVKQRTKAPKPATIKPRKTKATTSRTGGGLHLKR